MEQGWPVPVSTAPGKHARGITRPAQRAGTAVRATAVRQRITRYWRRRGIVLRVGKWGTHAAAIVDGQNVASL